MSFFFLSSYEITRLIHSFEQLTASHLSCLLKIAKTLLHPGILPQMRNSQSSCIIPPFREVTLQWVIVLMFILSSHRLENT